MSDPRRSNGSRRDRLVRRVRNEETHCHLCGQPVDVTLPHGRPGSPEVDELLPVAFGGSPFKRENVRLAHRHCNRQRSTKPVPIARELLRKALPRFDAQGNLVARKTVSTRQSRAW